MSEQQQQQGAANLNKGKGSGGRRGGNSDFVEVKGKPDRNKYNEEQDSIKAEIEKVEKKLKSIQIEKGTKGGPIQERRDVLRKELDAIKEENRKHKGERLRVLDAVRNQQDIVNKKVEALTTAKREAPFKSADDLDAHVKSLEDQVNTGMLPLVDEKRLLAKISQLKKQRSVVTSFSSMQKEIDAAKAKADELRKQLDALPGGKRSGDGKDRYAEIIAELDGLNAEYTKARESRDKKFEERNKVKEQLDKLYEKKRASAKTFKESQDKYHQKVQAAIAERDERRRAERAEIETQKRDARFAEWREKALEPAYETSIADLKAVRADLAKRAGISLPSASAGAAAQESTGASTDSSLPQLPELRPADTPSEKDGFKLLQKKKLEDFSSPKTAPKSKSSSSKNTPSRLTLHFGTVEVLLNNSLPVPKTTAEISDVISKIDGKIDHLVKTQDEATQSNIDAVEAKIAKELAKASEKSENDQPSA